MGYMGWHSRTWFSWGWWALDPAKTQRRRAIGGAVDQASCLKEAVILRWLQRTGEVDSGNLAHGDRWFVRTDYVGISYVDWCSFVGCFVFRSKCWKPEHRDVDTCPHCPHRRRFWNTEGLHLCSGGIKFIVVRVQCLQCCLMACFVRVSNQPIGYNQFCSWWKKR